MKNEQSYRSYGNGTGVGGRSVTKNFDGPRKPLSFFSRSGKSLTCVRFIVASEFFTATFSTLSSLLVYYFVQTVVKMKKKKGKRTFYRFYHLRYY